MKYYRIFAKLLLTLEPAPLEAQRTAIRALRRTIRALLERYRAFLRTAPADVLKPFTTTGPNGQPMNPLQIVDYVLERAF